MKRVLTCGGGLLLSIALVSTAFAGAIDNKTNWSAEYIRTLNRNAATDYADVAAYNPAGTVKLADGFILNGSVQYLGKEYANNITVAPNTVLPFESDESSLVPGLFGVYNRDRWSFFGAVTVVGGGGKVDFSQGNWTTTQIGGLLTSGMVPYLPLCPLGKDCENFNPTDLTGQKLEAESYYMGYTLGGAFEINDIFSVSAGIRYVNAKREAQGFITLLDANYNPNTSYVLAVNYEQEGDGWGGIFGINIAPNDKLNIGMRYEMKTKLDLEATVPVGVGAGVLQYLTPPIVNGQSNARDLPATFGFGLSYWLTPQLRLETNYTHYFNTDADWSGAEKNVDDGYDLGIALEYHFNESFLGSIGYLRTETGIEPQYMLPENPELDANTIGAGIAYAINEKFHTNLSLGYVFYESDSFIAPPTVEYEKKIFFLALGLEYRFL